MPERMWELQPRERWRGLMIREQMRRWGMKENQSDRNVRKLMFLQAQECFLRSGRENRSDRNDLRCLQVPVRKQEQAKGWL